MPFDGHLPWTIRNMGPLYIPRKGDIIPITAKEACVYRMLLEWETGKKVDFDWISNTAKIDGKEFTSHTFSHNYYFTQVSEVKIQYSMPSGQVGLVMPSGDCQQ